MNVKLYTTALYSASHKRTVHSIHEFTLKAASKKNRAKSQKDMFFSSPEAAPDIGPKRKA